VQPVKMLGLIRMWRSGDAPAHCMVPFTVAAPVNYGDSVLLIGDSVGLTLRIRIPFVQAADIREGTILQISWRQTNMHCIPA
jgi:hypothetical protein